MKRFIVSCLAVAAVSALLPCAAFAWNLHGHIFCDATGLELSGVQINVSSTDGAGFSGSTASDANGFFEIALPNTPGCYEATAALGAGESIVSPVTPFDFCTTADNFEIQQDWVISSPACSNEGCWLTGGGAKFSTITRTDLGVSNSASSTKKVKEFNWGGNVNPGCSPTAGQGGQWNTIDNAQRLHFQGTAIQVVRCGNVDGIPPGSTSPATPFNFIEFKGTGRVKGIQGNKADYPLVYFFGRAEDRNEPGSNGQRDGAGKDRYFLNVYLDPTNPVGTSIMLVDMDGDPSTVDPLIITDGNMQIHVSSCDSPAPPLALAQPVNGNSAAAAMQPGIGRESVALPTEPMLAMASANPTSSPAALRFALPRDANVSIAVFDVAGRQVGRILDGPMAAGTHTTIWNLQTVDGARAARGVYFVRMMVDGRVLSRTVTIK